MPRRAAVLLVAVSASTALAGERSGKVVRVEQAPSSIVEVAGGTFPMGITDDDIEMAVSGCLMLHGAHRFKGICAGYQEMLSYMLAREVNVASFAIDRYEVTVGEYRACVHAGSCELDPLLAGDERHVADDALPVVNVTWDEARTFCQWRDGRLPTEAEWEKAARGEEGRRWPWGDRDRPDDFNHGRLPPEATSAVDDLEWRTPTFGSNRANYTQFGEPDDTDGHAYAMPPGSLPWNEGPYGTLDQAGNVAEWVQDEYSDDQLGYYGLPDTNPVRNPDGGASVRRVFRGGSWRDPQMHGWTFLRPVLPVLGTQRLPQLGFRCAYDR
jgi:formylglycine-generating enzyme